MNNYEARILSERNDYTGALEKVELITKILNKDVDFLKNQKVLALYGDWGSGKSSIIQTLLNHENIKRQYKPILFEAWEYEKDNNLSLSLFEMLLSHSTKKSRDDLINVSKSFYSIVKGAAKGVTFNIPLAGNLDCSKIFEELEKLQEGYFKKSFHSEKEDLKAEFNKVIDSIEKDGKLLIFIDDLDRCENENIISLITSIKHLFTLSDDIIFIMTIDKNAITQALKVKYGENSEKAEEYLEKIFPLNFSLNKSLNYDKYFDELRIEKSQIRNDLNQNEDQKIRTCLKDFFIKYDVITPRKFIRVLNKVKLLEIFNEVQSMTAENYRAFLYLTAFNLFTLAEYNREGYNNFFKTLKKNNYSSNYRNAFEVQKGDKQELNPIYDYLTRFENRFPLELYRDFKEILKIIEILV